MDVQGSMRKQVAYVERLFKLGTHMALNRTLANQRGALQVIFF
jgi:hypothetical protein